MSARHNAVRTSRTTAVAIRIAALLFFVIGALPRSATYVHSHADSGHAHVHAWDGARADDIRQLIDDARGDAPEHPHSHPHPHPHEHAVDAAHDHPVPAAETAQRTSKRPRGPAIAAAAASSSEHTHAQAPFQTFGTRAAVALPVRASSGIASPQATTRPVARACPALRARAPPPSAQA